MQENSDLIKLKKPQALETIIEESIKSKAKIVTADEKEKGLRAILNFGHTFGHAIEAYKKYQGITHGAAVTLGMVIAAKISLYEGHIKSHQLDDLVNLLESLELKTDYSKYSYENLKNYILNDKKVSKGKLNLVLINEKGAAFKTDKYNSRNLQKAFN
jgi:3-dehydroquinate synthetase